MKSLAVGFTATLLFAGLGFAAPANKTYTGEIMDSACAAMGSHAAMLKGHGMAGKEDDPAAKRTCTLDCVKAGSKFVLYDAGTKTVYQLDDQKKPGQFAGEKVAVTGTLDPSTKTIHVARIKAAS